VTALAAAALGVVAAPSAGAAGVLQPIGPHESFVGQVNGVTVGAAIKVGCFGPVTSTSTGHPLAGQTVAVQIEADPTSKDDGYTGDAANQVAVEFDSLPTSSAALLLHYYGVTAEIPTTLSLPCEGTGTVVFVPGPTSNTARSASVAVTYVNAGL